MTDKSIESPETTHNTLQPSAPPIMEGKESESLLDSTSTPHTTEELNLTETDALTPPESDTAQITDVIELSIPAELSHTLDQANATEFHTETAQDTIKSQEIINPQESASETTANLSSTSKDNNSDLTIPAPSAFIASDIHVNIPPSEKLSSTSLENSNDTSPISSPSASSSASDTSPSLKERAAQLEKGNQSFAGIKEKFPNLGRPLVLDEGKFPKGSQISIWTITLMVGAFVAWAAVTPIKEVAVSQGQVIPSSFVKTVQHLEGGIVKDILVEDGSEVKKGDILLRLESATALSDLEQMRVKEMGLRIKAERLRAFGMEEKPNFTAFEKDFPNLVKDQQSIYDMQDKNRNDQREVLKKQIEQRKATLAVQEGRVQDFEHQAGVLEKQRDVIKGLYQKRLKTGTEYRSTEDRLAAILVELNQARNSVLESLQGIRELESRVLELTTRLRNEALMEMGNVTAEIAQVEEAKTNLQDRVKRLDVIAPSSGIVKGLKHTTLHGVVQPGGEILQVVPKENMEVEAKVQPKDVGKLRPGQNVLVKVTAFDYARYGGIKGKVKSVSATTFTDEKNNPFYRVFISLKKQYVGASSKKQVITPGMMVQADIETDEKTLLQYLIKPIYIALHDSFHER